MRTYRHAEIPFFFFFLHIRRRILFTVLVRGTVFCFRPESSSRTAVGRERVSDPTFTPQYLARDGRGRDLTVLRELTSTVQVRFSSVDCDVKTRVEMTELSESVYRNTTRFAAKRQSGWDETHVQTEEIDRTRPDRNALATWCAGCRVETTTSIFYVSENPRRTSNGRWLPFGNSKQRAAYFFQPSAVFISFPCFLIADIRLRVKSAVTKGTTRDFRQRFMIFSVVYLSLRVYLITRFVSIANKHKFKKKKKNVTPNSFSSKTIKSIYICRKTMSTRGKWEKTNLFELNSTACEGQSPRRVFTLFAVLENPFDKTRVSLVRPRAWRTGKNKIAATETSEHAKSSVIPLGKIKTTAYERPTPHARSPRLRLRGTVRRPV